MTDCVVMGRVTEDGKLEVDERVPLAPGPVRVSVEAASAQGGGLSASLLLTPEEWRIRKARMDAAIGCLSDAEAAEILRIVEEEFEQVNLDDWR
jgi:hypothetical protein